MPSPKGFAPKCFRPLNRQAIVSKANLGLALIASATSPMFGAIVYSGSQNLPIQSIMVNNGVYFDLEPPFSSAQAADNEPTWGWEFNPDNFGRSISVNGNTMLARAGDGGVQNLPPNAVIDNSLVFTAAGIGGSTKIAEGNTGYIAFRFDPDGIAGSQMFYGWIQTTVGGDTFGNGNVIAWAYENTGAAINAGAVPEPGSLSILAAAVGCSASRRRRKGEVNRDS